MNSSDIGENRQTYLRFDLSSAPTNFNNAILELYGKASVDCHINVYAFTKKNWYESSLNWNNKIETQTGLLVKSEIGLENNWYSFDVSKYIKGQFANNVRDITFVLKGVENITAPVKFNSKENSSNQPKLHFSNGIVSGIETVMKNQISIYPNPASNLLVVKDGNNYKGPVLVQVFSTTGQKFLSREMNFVSGELKINIAELPNNLYILHLTEQKEGEIISSKFIKTRR